MTTSLPLTSPIHSETAWRSQMVAVARWLWANCCRTRSARWHCVQDGWVLTDNIVHKWPVVQYMQNIPKGRVTLDFPHGSGGQVLLLGKGSAPAPRVNFTILSGDPGRRYHQILNVSNKRWINLFSASIRLQPFSMKCGIAILFFLCATAMPHPVVKPGRSPVQVPHIPTFGFIYYTWFPCVIK